MDYSTFISSLFNRVKDDHALKSDRALARWLSDRLGFTVNAIDIGRWSHGETGKAMRVLLPIVLYYRPDEAPDQIAPIPLTPVDAPTETQAAV